MKSPASAYVSLKYRQRIFYSLLRAYYFPNNFNLNLVEWKFPIKGISSEFTIECLKCLDFKVITILRIVYIYAHWIKSVKIMRNFFGEYIIKTRAVLFYLLHTFFWQISQKDTLMKIIYLYREWIIGKMYQNCIYTAQNN